MNFSSIFVALPCRSVILFEFSNISAILGDEVAKPNNGRRGERTRAGSVPPHHLRPLSKKKKEKL